MRYQLAMFTKDIVEIEKRYYRCMFLRNELAARIFLANIYLESLDQDCRIRGYPMAFRDVSGFRLDGRRRPGRPDWRLASCVGNHDKRSRRMAMGVLGSAHS